MSELTHGAYVTGARSYWEAGWVNILPIGDGNGRPGKSHPPAGYTGYNGRNVSWPDLMAWMEGEQGRLNLGLRMQAMVGIDVDAHDGELGAQTIEKAERELGPLPPTYSSTSRGPGASRILFYRVPLAREPLLARREKVLVDTYGPNVEILHKAHRYAVAWPSVHPDTGQTYQWYGPDGRPCIVPRRTDIPELPETWLDFLAPEQPAAPEPISAPPGSTVTAGTAGSQLFGGGPVSNMRSMKKATALLADAYRAFTAPDADGRAKSLLPRLALVAGHGIPGGFWTEQQARQNIERAGIECGYVEKHGLADLRNQVERGLRDGAAEPWILVAEPEEPSAFDEARNEARGGRLRKAMLKRSEVHSLPEPVPLINDVLYRSSVVVLSGKFGTYKSFIAVSWAASLAAGKPWFGHEVLEAVPVIYAAAEGAYGIRRRLNAWESAHGPIPDDLYLIPVSARINNAADMRELEEIVVETGARVLIFDTMHASTPGADENDAGEMGAVMDVLRGLQERHGVCSILPHHTGHAGERARGSSSLEDDADTAFVVRLSGEDRDAGNIRTLVHRKTKDGPLLPDVELELRLVEHSGSGYVCPRGTDAWRDAETAPRLPEHWEIYGDELATRILTVLLDHGQEFGLTKAESMRTALERWYEGKVSRLPRTTWYTAWDRAHKFVSPEGEKVIVSAGGQRWRVDEDALLSFRRSLPEPTEEIGHS